MKHKIILLSSILIIIFSPLGSRVARAINQANDDLLSRQIEILKQESSLLQKLLLSSQSQQKITAQSYLAISLTDNSVILSKKPDQTYPIASITKLMNAVIAVENVDTKRTVTLTKEMLKPLGSSPALYPGLKISVENLLEASLIQSTNDASEALADFIGKTKFIKLMNQKAKELKMTKTVFYDAHGLNPKNHSTANDLVKLLTYIYKNHPEILSITRDNNFWLPDPTGKLLKFKNINNFYPLSAFIGGKAGYLVEAKQTLASVFNVNGKPTVIVLLYSDNSLADTLSILKKISL